MSRHGMTRSPAHRHAMPGHTVSRRGALALLAASLAACGGGSGGDGTGEPTTTGPVTKPLADPPAPALPGAPAAAQAPALVPRRLVTLDHTDAGLRRLVTVGATRDGDLAVLWLARDPGADPLASWTLWLQRYAANGQRVGDSIEVPYAPDVPDPGDVAAVVRGNGDIVVAWITDRRPPPDEGEAWVSTLSLCMYSPQGIAWSDERVVDSTLHDPNVPTGKVLRAPVLAQWGDGRLLLGWRAHLSDRPAFESDSLRILEMGPGGLPLRPVDRLWDAPAPLLQLATLDRGGWVARTLGGSFAAGDVHARLVQVAVDPPLGLPLPQQLPALSWLLPLHGGAGSVLFSGRHGSTPGSLVEPFMLPIAENGREADQGVPLPALPTHALALDNGDYLAFWPQGPAAPLLARRFAPDGTPVGRVFDAGALDATCSCCLPGGGMALAWVAPSGAGQDVLLQRWDEEVSAT